MNKLKTFLPLVVLSTLSVSALANTNTATSSISDAASKAGEVIMALIPAVAIIGGAVIAVAVAIGGFGLIRNMAKRI